MGILNSGLRRMAVMALALFAAIPAQAQYPFETTVKKEEERFQAIIKNHSGNASFEFIQGITLEVQWWELLGEPVNYYKLKWNRGMNFQLPSGTTRDDLSKYPDLLRRFDAMKPLSFEFEIDFELKDMKPNCGSTIKDTDTFARGSRFVNSTKHLLIGKNGEVQSSLSPGSGSWADFATWLNDETHSPAVVKKTFDCATTLTLYKISTLKAEIPEREIAAIDAAYAKREKEKEQKAEEEKKKKEDKLKDLAARLNGDKKAAAPDSSADGIAGRLLNAEKKLEARLEAERKARLEAERRRLEEERRRREEEERRRREREQHIKDCTESYYTTWDYGNDRCQKLELAKEPHAEFGTNYAAGGAGVHVFDFDGRPRAGSQLYLSYNMNSVPDRIIVIFIDGGQENVVYDSGMIGGSYARMLKPFKGQKVKVVLTGSENGTAWNFSISEQ